MTRKLDRRRLLRAAAWGSACMLGGGGALSAWGERNWPRIVRVDVPLPGLPPDLHGFTICQLSDIHRNLWVSEAFVRGAVDRANALGAQLTVLTGDYVSGPRHDLDSAAAALSGLRAPLGVYGITGNHDYTCPDPERLLAGLERGGIRVLRNASASLTTGETDWWLCGLDDTQRGEPDLERTLRGVDPAAFRILLCHEPDHADDVVSQRFPLQLSGHSHGGQIVLPKVGPLITPRKGRKYVSGLRTVEGTSSLVYTNVGLGVITVPIRLNCPPEITLLRLTRPPAAVSV
jgi:predicted MPP superfamily phosphohydrolase